MPPKRAVEAKDSTPVWPNYGLSGGLMGQGVRARGKAAMVLVLLAKRCG